MKRTLAILALASFGLMAAPKPPTTEGTPTETKQVSKKRKNKKPADKTNTEKPADTTAPVKQ